MLDKRRFRRMNAVLGGLAQDGYSVDFQTGDVNAVQDSQPAYTPDFPVDSGLPDPTGVNARATLPDFPTVLDSPAPPMTSPDLALLNKFIGYGGQVYQYVQGHDSHGRPVAVPRVAQKGAATQRNYLPLIIAAAVLYSLL